MTGHIERLLPHHAIIRSDVDGVAYWMYRTNLARYHRVDGIASFDDLAPTMGVEFTPIAAGRAKDNPVALDVRVTTAALTSE